VNLDGSVVLPAPPEAVWAMVTDPAVLARTIPGCVSLEQAGEDSYRMTVTAGVGAIRGTYAGEVRLADLAPHTSYVMHASGTGAAGSVRATVTINLAPDGDATVLTYSADAVVGGAVAGVGQRMITGVAKRTAGQFFAALEAELASSRVPVPARTADGAAEPPARAPSAAVTGSAAPAGGWIPDGSRPLLVGAAGGGVLTLLGVWVGYLLGRRR
jgi:uncharacterized protein